MTQMKLKPMPRSSFSCYRKTSQKQQALILVGCLLMGSGASQIGRTLGGWNQVAVVGLLVGVFLMVFVPLSALASRVYALEEELSTARSKVSPTHSVSPP